MTHQLLSTLRPLLAAEASAEAYASGTEPADLEQAVWLRLLERLDASGPPVDPQRWLRRAVRSESRRTRRTARIEQSYGDDPVEDSDRGPSRPRSRRRGTARCTTRCAGCPVAARV